MDARDIPGVILAGGLGRRMGGGDKPLRSLAGRPLLSHVIDRLASQCGPLAINANGDPARFAAFGLPVMADDVVGGGPLAGVLVAMEWASATLGPAAVVLTAPGDCPFLPHDLAIRLETERRNRAAAIACAVSGDRRHPLTAVWRADLRFALRDALEHEGMRRVGDWVARHSVATVTWDAAPIDPFFNANTPEDLAEAERHAG